MVDWRIRYGPKGDSCTHTVFGYETEQDALRAYVDDLNQLKTDYLNELTELQQEVNDLDLHYELAMLSESGIKRLRLEFNNPNTATNLDRRRTKKRKEIADLSVRYYREATDIRSYRKRTMSHIKFPEFDVIIPDSVREMCKQQIETDELEYLFDD